jgi:hypothetical protein
MPKMPEGLMSLCGCKERNVSELSLIHAAPQLPSPGRAGGQRPGDPARYRLAGTPTSLNGAQKNGWASETSTFPIRTRC